MTQLLSARCAVCQYPMASSAGDCFSSTGDSFKRWVCSYCDSALPRPNFVCTTCGQDLPASSSIKQCGACLKSKPAIDQLVAAFDYDYPINQWLPLLKFERFSALAKWFGKSLATESIRQLSDLPDIIIPVPLHPKRLRHRGYNQAELIAKALMLHLPQTQSIQLNTSCCKRIVYTQAQSGLSLKQRQQNIKAAFSSESLPEVHVAIVDDVYTSGSTVNSLAKCLKQAGAMRVTALVAAHAALK